MYKTDEEAERILNHSLNIAKVSIMRQPEHQKGIFHERETPNRTLEEKAQIGTLAHLIGNKNTSELLGIEKSQVTKMKNGKNNLYHPDKELAEKIADNLAPIRNKAIANVEFLLDIVSSKASNMSGSKAASAAKSMVEVYDKLGPKNPALNINTPQVVFYAPRVLESNDYPVIEVEAVNG
jgi:hypothetical protein